MNKEINQEVFLQLWDLLPNLTILSQTPNFWLHFASFINQGKTFMECNLIFFEINPASASSSCSWDKMISLSHKHVLQNKTSSKKVCIF